MSYLVEISNRKECGFILYSAGRISSLLVTRCYQVTNVCAGFHAPCWKGGRRDLSCWGFNCRSFSSWRRYVSRSFHWGTALKATHGSPSPEPVRFTPEKGVEAMHHVFTCDKGIQGPLICSLLFQTGYKQSWHWEKAVYWLADWLTCDEKWLLYSNAPLVAP